MVKQESQARSRRTLSPLKSLTSSTEAQKQVGQTDGAIGAGQTALGNLRPARMLKVIQQQVVNIGRVEVPFARASLLRIGHLVALMHLIF